MRTATASPQRPRARRRANARPINAFYPVTLSVLWAMVRLNAAGPTIVAALGLLWLNVALHEAGHVIVARAAGHRVLRVLILPGYGRTSVRSHGRPGRVAMMLAGPLTGALAAGAALTSLGVTAGVPPEPLASAVAWLSWAMLADNLLNLLPFGVLDGRRALTAHREQRALVRLSRVADLAARTAAADAAGAAVELDERETFAREARRELDEILSTTCAGTPDAAAARSDDTAWPAPACCEVTS